MQLSTPPMGCLGCIHETFHRTSLGTRKACQDRGAEDCLDPKGWRKKGPVCGKSDGPPKKMEKRRSSSDEREFRADLRRRGTRSHSSAVEISI